MKCRSHEQHVQNIASSLPLPHDLAQCAQICGSLFLVTHLPCSAGEAFVTATPALHQCTDPHHLLCSNLHSISTGPP